MIVHKIPKAVAILSIVIGAVVITGWVFDLDFLVSISPDWPAMKFISAMCFVFSGITILYVEKEIHEADELSSYFAALSSLIVFLFMAILLSSRLFDISVGMEDLFIKEKPLAVKSVVAGQPSLLSTINFFFISMCGFVLLTKPKRYNLFFLVIGATVGLVSIGAITGYLINTPGMYSYIPNISNGMSFCSAVLFLLLGISLVLIGLMHKNKTA